MAWYPGKNIVSGIRNLGGNIMDNRREKQALKSRAMGPPGPAPQIAGANAMFGQDRGAQMGALQGFADTAAGRGPSMAQQQGAQAYGQTITDQLSVASQGRGGNMAAQARAAQGIGAAGQMGAAQNQAAMALAEQQAAQQAYANQANAMAGQTGGFVGQNADIATQWGMGQRGMDLQALQQKQQNQLGWADRIIGGGMGLMQGAAMFSDENLKTDIEPDEDAAGNTLASLKPVRYRYQNERHGPTEEETVGFLAQDLEGTPLGKRLVKEIPGEGKAVDIPGLVSLLTAHGSGVEHRLRSLEGKR